MTAGAESPAAALAARVHEGWLPFRRALARVGLTALAEPTSVGWSLRDMIVHFSAWHDLTTRRLETFQATGAPVPAGVDVDAFNVEAAAAARDRSAHEVIQDLDTSYRRLREAVASLGDAQVVAHLADGRGWVQALVDINTFGHYAEHQSEVDAAVPRTPAELVDRIERAWRPFREAVRDRGRAGLGEATGAGWAYKDVVAHTIGWLQEAVKELRIREFTRWDSPSIDAQNARTVLARKLVGPEALLDELDTSYRSFVAAVRSLSDADLADDQVFGAAAFCGHLHWEHHFGELRVQL